MLTRSSHIITSKLVAGSKLKAVYFTKWFVRPALPSPGFYESQATKNGLFVLNSRFMSAKKVVFKSELGMQENDNKADEPTLQKLSSENNEQTSQQKPISFSSVDKAEKHYEHEQKLIFEKQREKWIHNITKKFSEDLYQDSIESSTKQLSGLEKYQWLDQEKERIKSSADPYASLISKAIQHSTDNQNNNPLTIEEINSLPVGEVLQRLQKYENKEKALENEHYLAIRKKAIRHLCEDAFSLSMIKDSELGKNLRYLNLLTDLFVNTYNQSFADPHECVTDFKLLSFLIFSPSKTLANTEYNIKLQNMLVKELFNDPGHLSTVQELKISEEMNAIFLYLKIIKKYNFYQGMDVYFRELAKVFIEMKEEGLSHPAETFQQILNCEFSINPTENKAYVQEMDFRFKKDNPSEIPIDHGLARNPQFIFGAKAQKIQEIMNYRQTLAEFDKIKEMKSFLKSSLDNPEVFSKLMTNTNEFKQLLSMINENNEHIKDDGMVDKLNKIASIYDEVTSNFVKNTFGIYGVGLHNMYEIYSPLKNGIFDNILASRDKFVKQGLLIEEANRLAEEYCRRNQETSKGPFKLYQLIESHLENSQEAIKQFHDCENMKRVNFYTPTLEQFRFSVSDRRKKAGSLVNHLRAGGDLNQFNKLGNTVFNTKLSSEPVRFKMNRFTNFSTRPFCSKQQEDSSGKTGGFTQYLKKLIQIEKKKEDDSKSDSNIESLLTKDPAEIKIGFHKIKSSITLDNQGNKPEDTSDAAMQAEVKKEDKPNAEQLFIKQANERFSSDFFKDFSLSDESLMQISLEEYIRDLKNTEDIPLFVASLISNAYELNSWIPNAHMMLYKMFCSPKINEKERKETEKKDLLSGNLFNNHISQVGYKSLLHSVLLTGKKKHFKKIIMHMNKFLKPEDFNDEIIQKVIEISVVHDFPILLGKTMKDFIDNGVIISKENYISFYMYLDRCKGLEKDVLRFLFSVNNTSHIQIDWDFVKPIFMRATTFKKGTEVLELFDYVKQKLLPNKKNELLPKEEQDALMNKIREEFYVELIDLLLNKKGFVAANVIYNEYKKHMADADKNGILGMKINCTKGDINEFEKFFNENITKDAMPFIMKFKTDENSVKVINMTVSILNKMIKEGDKVTGQVFKSMVDVFLTYQQWKQILDVLIYTTPETILEEKRIVKQIKENMIYCMDQTIRGQIKGKIETREAGAD